eukprot:TRINITY_DN4111_c0_g2_i3.p1 TRINITY_DN4111_c0_g2~~TRINITY_DN4111_c0_g2_i3.p1  ORF type:complete len:574 (+),score=132.04 TRINITY_DN4111_c0_g2_i3:547-2268(+)
MGKQGPCCHCGISTTPLWRNGPPEKPVLCNACGSRWRTKGTLANYMPMHSGGCGANAALEYRWPRGKKTSQKLKEDKSYKKKDLYDILPDVDFSMNSNQRYLKKLDEETSTRSSSVSCLSYSEGCIQHSFPYDKYTTVAGQSTAWDSPVPSKKRTCMSRQRPSSLDKLTKSMHASQEHESSYFSGSSEEDLLYECKDTMDATEIGLGGVFVRQPNSLEKEEESEASSFLLDSKGYGILDGSQVYTGVKEGGGRVCYGDLKEHEHLRAVDDLKRVIQNLHLPLILIALEDVVNFDTFTGVLKEEEQALLMKYLSSVDIFEAPESLKSMFDSPQFRNTLSDFQHLLAEDAFGISGSNLSPQADQLFQQLLITTDLINSRWIERYSRLRNCSRPREGSDISKIPDRKLLRNKGLGHATPFLKSGRPSLYYRESMNSSGQPSGSIEDHERSRSAWSISNSDGLYHENIDTGSTSKEATGCDNDQKSALSLDPNSLFIAPHGKCSPIMFESIGDIMDEDLDSILLFDVPANLSFPQAELLHAPVLNCKKSNEFVTDTNNDKRGENNVQVDSTVFNSEL